MPNYLLAHSDSEANLIDWHVAIDLDWTMQIRSVFFYLQSHILHLPWNDYEIHLALTESHLNGALGRSSCGSRKDSEN